jgi:hypothetical protein
MPDAQDSLNDFPALPSWKKLWINVVSDVGGTF